MVACNYLSCLAFTLKREGGYVNNPLDKGGPTYKGITINRYSEYLKHEATIEELKTMPYAHLQDIYKEYWDGVSGDTLPMGVDLVAFDAAVNSGISRGNTWLTRSIGTNPEEVILAFCVQRTSFLLSLNNQAEETFEKGWITRVLACLQEAQRMVK